jgi:predicted phage terminase large subunit-like protein
MIQKTTEALELSYALGKDGGIRRFIGTRYHFNDTYKTIMDRGTATPRIYAAMTESGQDGVLLDAQTLADKRRDMGPYTFGTQMMLNPKGDETQGFRREWLRHYDNVYGGRGMNKYLLIDPASSKKQTGDYTAAWVIGISSDDNYYALDVVRDRLSLTQRAELVMRLHRKWKPLETRYEEYGLMADIEHIKTVQEKEQYRFEITKVGGRTAKSDRIKRLIPIFEQGRMYLPKTLNITDYEGKTVDVIHSFIEEEYLAFPVPLHDDLLDGLARIAEPELKLKWPAKEEPMPKVNAWKPSDSAYGY